MGWKLFYLEKTGEVLKRSWAAIPNLYNLYIMQLSCQDFFHLTVDHFYSPTFIVAQAGGGRAPSRLSLGMDEVPHLTLRRGNVSDGQFFHGLPPRFEDWPFIPGSSRVQAGRTPGWAK